VFTGGSKVNEDELGRACSMHNIEAECIQDFGGKARGKEDLDIGGRIIFKMDLREIEGGGMDWVHLAQDKDQ
jgi:hypothetical protein